jgi:hypothetical protein
MDRRAFVSGVTLTLFTAPLAAEAQSTPTVRRIGVIGGAAPEYIEARKEGLRRLGWVEGQNIVVEQISVGNKSSAQLQEVARDIRSPQGRSHHGSQQPGHRRCEGGDHDHSDCHGPCG